MNYYFFLLLLLLFTKNFCAIVAVRRFRRSTFIERKRCKNFMRINYSRNQVANFAKIIRWNNLLKRSNCWVADLLGTFPVKEVRFTEHLEFSPPVFHPSFPWEKRWNSLLSVFSPHSLLFLAPFGKVFFSYISQSTSWNFYAKLSTSSWMFKATIFPADRAHLRKAIEEHSPRVKYLIAALCIGRLYAGCTVILIALRLFLYNVHYSDRKQKQTVL